LAQEFSVALREEAKTQGKKTDLITIEKFSLDADGALRGKRRVSAAGPGPVLNRLHFGLGRELAEKSEIGDFSIFPTRSSFLYYAPGDYVLLHHDVTQCTVTILATLGDSADPLYAYPGFGTAGEADIPHLNGAPFDSRESFETYVGQRIGEERVRSAALRLKPTFMVALPGRDLLHARYPQDSPVVVVALCYSALAHRPQWAGS
jgi:hypothetical protein